MIIKKIFLDTETTGLDTKKNGLFSLGGVICYEETYEEFDLFCDIFSEDIIDPEAMEKNGYTNEQLKSFPDPFETYTRFIEMLSRHVDRYNPKDKFHVFGYFSEFDCQFLRQWFINNGDKYFGSWFFHPWIDVAVIAAHHLMNTRFNLPNFKLQTVANFLDIETSDSKCHTALYDAKLTKEIYEICSEDRHQSERWFDPPPRFDQIISEEDVPF